MSSDIPFSNLTRVVRRGWTVIVAVTLLCGLIGVLAKVIWPESYEATASIEITDDAGVDGTNMRTQETIARSTGVLVAALDGLSGWDLEGLKDSLSVTVPRDSDVLEVTVWGETPKKAAAAANAVARSYLEDRRGAIDSQLQRNLQELETEIAELETELVGAAEGTVQTRVLEERLAATTTRYSDARADVADPGRVLSSALPPSSASTPGLIVWVAAGLLVGAMLGFYIASILDRVRRARSG